MPPNNPGLQDALRSLASLSQAERRRSPEDAVSGSIPSRRAALPKVCRWPPSHRRPSRSLPGVPPRPPYAARAGQHGRCDVGHVLHHRPAEGLAAVFMAQGSRRGQTRMLFKNLVHGAMVESLRR